MIELELWKKKEDKRSEYGKMNFQDETVFVKVSGWVSRMHPKKVSAFYLSSSSISCLVVVQPSLKLFLGSYAYGVLVASPLLFLGIICTAVLETLYCMPITTTVISPVDIQRLPTLLLLPTVF